MWVGIMWVGGNAGERKGIDTLLHLMVSLITLPCPYSPPTLTLTPTFTLTHSRIYLLTPSNTCTAEAESVLVSEIVVTGVEGGLRQTLEAALTAKPNYPYTVKDIQVSVQGERGCHSSS